MACSQVRIYNPVVEKPWICWQKGQMLSSYYLKIGINRQIGYGSLDPDLKGSGEFD